MDQKYWGFDNGYDRPDGTGSPRGNKETFQKKHDGTYSPFGIIHKIFPGIRSEI